MSKLRKSEREREKKSERERERERDLGIAREGKKPTPEGIEREDKLLIVEARRSERRG